MANYPSSAASQYIYASSATFATARDATTGTVDNGTFYTGCDYSDAYYIYHAFVNCDTSAIPDDEIILSASLFLYCVSKATTSEESLCLVLADNTDPAGLYNDDFNNCGAKDSPAELADRQPQANFTVNAWTEIPLNTLGRAYINPLGYTKFGLRGSNDIDNSAPSTAGRTYISFSGYNAGANKPYLAITTNKMTYYFPARGRNRFNIGGVSLGYKQP